MVQISPKIVERMISAVTSTVDDSFLGTDGGVDALRDAFVKEFESEIQQYNKLVSFSREKSRAQYSSMEGREKKKEDQRRRYRQKVAKTTQQSQPNES